LTFETAPEGKESFLMKVSDTGIGISGENLDKLFVPFLQIDAGTKRRHEGSGLGLALTKNIIELQKGTICVESEEAKGSTFSIVMPLRLENDVHE
jgi:signal transduction histidine kinase